MTDPKRGQNRLLEELEALRTLRVEARTYLDALLTADLVPTLRQYSKLRDLFKEALEEAERVGPATGYHR